MIERAEKAKSFFRNLAWIFLAVGLIGSGCGKGPSPALPTSANSIQALATTSSLGAIVSGILWPDQNGNNVQGHGGNIIKVGSTYYWFGEDKTNENSSNATFQNVPCYSSTD